MKHLFACAVLIGSIAVMPSVAFGAGRVRPPQQPVTTTAVSPSTALTESQCTYAGGTVSAEFFGVCLSGKVCSRPDENNKIHSVCIGKKKQ